MNIKETCYSNWCYGIRTAVKCDLHRGNKMKNKKTKAYTSLDVDSQMTLIEKKHLMKRVVIDKRNFSMSL